MASESAGVKREPSVKSVLGGQKTKKEGQIEKRKAELGVCRIRKILENGAGYQTVGSGAVVKDLMSQWPWKDKCCIVTSDKVLPGNDFHINDFYVDFKKLNSSKPKTFELGNIAMSDAVHRSTSGLVVIPLQDPKGFTIKKSSIFTYRPFTKGNELLNELLSPIVDDTGSSDFDVKPFQLKQMLDLQFVLHDGQSSFKTLTEFTGSSNRKPHGSVILSRGENLTAVGILHCRDDGSSRISPVWLSEETLSGLRPSNISREMSREQSTVQEQSASSNPEPAREIPAEQATQVDGIRHEVIPANRESDLTTSNIQAQGTERNSSQVNPDQGILSIEIKPESVTTRHPQNQSKRQQDFSQVMKEIAMDYLVNNDISTHEGLIAYNSFLSGAVSLHIKMIKSSSLIFVVQCRTLEILERLWTNYQSGSLNDVAESCLVSKKIRRKLDIESLTLKTTIDKEDYLACRRSFTKYLQGAKSYSAGLRVVCGPSWNVDKTDGKEGFVGTVVELARDSSSVPENMALVQWDIGLCQLHRAGHDGAFDLCVLDSSPSGVKHEGSACTACKQTPILGTCWSCLDCEDHEVNLCTSCYMVDEHDIQHVFQRKDSSKVPGISVGRRSKERKIQARGIYPGAKVTRGPDWEYDNQDGGIGSLGTVKKITNWKEHQACAAAVSWENGTESTYRLGYHGKVDLKCVTTNSGGYYYKGHLQSLGQKNKTHDLNWKSRAKNVKASRSALHKASVSGHFGTVKMLLENGEDVDQTDMFSLTPLHLAAWYGHESVVKLLLQHGADVNVLDRFQKTALQKAERHNHQSIVQLLLKNNATPSHQQPVSLKSLSRSVLLHVDRESGFNLLQAAVFEGKSSTVHKAHGLLGNVVNAMNFEKTGSNAKRFPGKTAVDILTSLDKKQKGHADIEKLYKDMAEIYNSLAALHMCHCNDDAEKAVELVLNEGIDINIPAQSNRTPLLVASLSSSSQFIKTLVDLGAQVNAQRTYDKVAPLGLAASWNNYMATRILLQHGAYANIQDNTGWIPLHNSAAQGCFSVSKLLIESGCKVNMRGNKDKTPLYFATKNKHERVVKLLLESNADVNMRYNQYPEEKIYLVRGKDKGRPAWHYVMVSKTLLGLFLKRTKGGRLDVADFGTVLKSGWGENPPESTRKEVDTEVPVLYKEVHGNTLLHQACQTHDTQLVELLVEHGADINCRDAEGFTPLHIAAIHGKMQDVKKLVELGADDSLTTLDGKDAAYLAELNEETEIEEFLKSNERPSRVMVGVLQDGAKERKLITEAFVDRAAAEISIPSGI